MENYERDFIDVVGLCPDPDTFDLNDSPYWTQISVPERLFLPEQKPDLKELDSLKVEVEIIQTKPIVTPVSVDTDGTTPLRNFEGKLLTGRKVIVDGKLCQTITYVSDTCEESLHTAHFVVPFSAYIVVPETVTVGTVTDVDSLNVNWKINVCVEDAFVKEVCHRDLFKNITMLLQAVPESVARCINGQ